jgi:acyl-CoA thioesterase-1
MRTKYVTGRGVVGGGRSRWLAAVFTTGLLAAACTGGGKPSAGTPQSTLPKATALGGDSQPATRGTSRGIVLILGTSLTAGLGLDPEQAYPALVQQSVDSAGLPFTVVNAGLSGETSAGALRRVEWLLRGPVDVFVLETGANDALRGLNVDSTRANIVAIIRAVRRARLAARICLVQMEAPPNMGPQYARAFHDLYASVAGAEGVTLVPFLLNGVAGKPELNQADGMHPNVRGERIVADRKSVV